MNRNKAVEKDPFDQDEPQVPCVYKGMPPPVLRNFDEAKGGINVKPLEIIDPAFSSDFVPPPVPDLNFSRKGKK